ncbi:MAG: Gfo/Idh/MocA family protein [Immundisolibacter sp.]|uniref:Gfo/Idh/MocA family protein n=1 Tax=Immundisolibacter sp. TaxID=1934948 RepID=UPI003EE3F53C
MSRLRLGIAGAGIAALQVLPHLKEIEDQIELTALADIRRDNMDYFAQSLGRSLACFEDVEAMCAQGPVDAVWVASPNRLHAEHVIAAARHGKHVICEKPMAVTLEQCLAMVQAVEAAGVKYVQGHSKVYDAPVRAMGQLIRSGELGRVTHLHTWNFNDWLIRALMPEEVRTDLGAGPVFRQGPHQVDTIRYLGGGRVRSVRAQAGRHEPHFPDCEGNYTAFLEFEDGTPATLIFDGYGYFDSVELTWGVGEAGKPAKNPDSRIPKARPPGPVSAQEKYAQVRGGNPYGYGTGGGWDMDAPQQQPFFGLTVVSCERGVIRQSPDGLYVYDAGGRRELPCPPPLGRAAELRELYEAVTQNRPTLLDVRWGMASAEVVMGILESSRNRAEVRMQHQTDVPVL